MVRLGPLKLIGLICHVGFRSESGQGRLVQFRLLVGRWALNTKVGRLLSILATEYVWD